jgi:NAD(P)-dependent dehydrogenase (short-subunit alcohol dehydrogenase family)
VNRVIVITGASSGFGALTARALADAGDVVYAGIRNTTSANANAVAELREYAASRQVELNPIEMEISSTEAVETAIASILEAQGRLDVVVHNAGHMVTGPTEAFTPEEVADIYDTNVLGTQRVNRAVLPHLRAHGSGLLVWVSSTSVKGGTPPYLGPYFAAKAAMDSLAVTYAGELARFGIDTTIIVPGSFTHGTNHFAHAGNAADTDTVAAYDVHYQGLLTDVAKRLADLAPPDADAGDVAAAIVSAVNSPVGKRPYRVHIDPADDGSAVVSAVADRIRVEFLNRIGLADLLVPVSPVTV